MLGGRDSEWPARPGQGWAGDVWRLRSGERRLSVGRTLAMPTAGASWIQVSHPQITMFLLTQVISDNGKGGLLILNEQ